jgi:hypothetical protein
MPKSFKTHVNPGQRGAPHAHSSEWDAALEQALEQASKNLGVGKYRIEVEFWADVEVTNPGQIFSYGVTLTKPD